MLAVTTVAVPLVPFALVGELPSHVWLAATDGHAVQIGSFGALLLAADLLLPIPSSVVGALLGARLGPALGFTFCLAGLICGHSLGYALGRLWPARWAPRHAPRTSPWIVLLSRPIPVVAEAAALSAGAARMPWQRFFLACITGDALYAFALVASGAHFLPKGAWAPALLAPIGIPVAGTLLWRRFSRRKAPPSRLASAAAGLNSNGGDAQPRSHHRPREPL